MTAVALAGAPLGQPVSALANQIDTNSLPIIDTHQHLWDLERQEVPWLKNAKSVLRRSHVTRDYLKATQGLNVIKAIYMEVDVAPKDHAAEVKLITELCKSPNHPTVAAVIGGRPGSETFSDYAREMATNPYVKGVRQVLHGATPRGHCLSQQFVRSMRLLGDLNLSFDLCMRAGELDDAVKLVDQCPDTQFIVDHCGNADPRAFLPARLRGNTKESRARDSWRKAMDGLGRQRHVVCKISGIVARAPQPNWSAEDLAPIVNHCLDTFGPDRVVFGSDWPVCRVGAELAEWVRALKEIVHQRPLAERTKLFSANAQRLYRLQA